MRVLERAIFVPMLRLTLSSLILPLVAVTFLLMPARDAQVRNAPPATNAAGQKPLLTEPFEGQDGLITNEHASRHAANPRPRHFIVTSGALFRRNGHAWSGRPDGGCGLSIAATAPGRCNGSAVFRLYSRRRFDDVSVSLRLSTLDLVETERTPARAFDGVHVLLRARSERELYSLTVSRRDSSAVIKKKCLGGPKPSNGGTYYTLGSVRHRFPFDRWQEVRALVRTSAEGSVLLALESEGRLLIEATDRGVGCPPLRGAGRVGLRADNAEFELDDLVVSAAQ